MMTNPHQRRRPGESIYSDILFRKDDFVTRFKRVVREEFTAIRGVGSYDKCLIRFHNCTKHRVTPFWIDECQARKYTTIDKGQWLNIDTYATHLWRFTSTEPGTSGHGKILAVPEDWFDLEDISRELDLSLEFNRREDVGERKEVLDEILSTNNGSVCSLCRFIIKKFPKAREVIDIPCGHFTGRTKFSLSNINFRPTYNYSCQLRNHRTSHEWERRNVYLVETFHTLAERCIIELEKRIKHTDIVKFKLPETVQEQYLRFTISVVSPSIRKSISNRNRFF